MTSEQAVPEGHILHDHHHPRQGKIYHNHAEGHIPHTHPGNDLTKVDRIDPHAVKAYGWGDETWDWDT